MLLYWSSKYVRNGTSMCWRMAVGRKLRAKKERKKERKKMVIISSRINGYSEMWTARDLQTGRRSGGCFPWSEEYGFGTEMEVWRFEMHGVVEDALKIQISSYVTLCRPVKSYWQLVGSSCVLQVDVRHNFYVEQICSCLSIPENIPFILGLSC